MEKYILLDAVLAEIEKRKRQNILNQNTFDEDISAFEEDIDILFFLNTLEVKEVDLEKEIDRVWDNTSDNFSEDGWKEFEDIAKHFFELGMRASNPLTWEDMKLIWTIGDDIPAMAEEDFYKELLKRFKALKRE